MVNIQGKNSGKLLAPAAAFTMAVVVVLYTRSSIKAARREAELRRMRDLEDAKGQRGQS
jgi:hypothetical protein